MTPTQSAIPAISGLNDTDHARILLYQSGRMVHAPFGVISADYVKQLLGVSDFALTYLDDADAATFRATTGTNSAANLTTGTLPDGRFPATLPVANGSNLTNLNASAATSGTLPDARVSATLTADKAFRRGNFLGTVSQSAGVPTGAAIERGSNSNGRYVRFADGTQVCTRVATESMTLSSSLGSIYYTTASWTYPAAFIDDETVLSGTARLNTTILDVWGRDPAGATGAGTTYFCVSGQSVSGSILTRLEARGRWF